MVRVTRQGAELAEGVAVITLADPSRHNALSEELMHAFQTGLDAVSRDRTTRAIVLAAEGETFCAGAPRELLVRLTRGGGMQPTDIVLPKLLLDCPVPIIAAMAGHATGGGFALGLTADLIILGLESRYGFTFMNMNFTPGMASTALCEHVLSPAIAHELLYTGELRRGAAFINTGVNAVLPRADVMPRALDIAARIAEKPRVAVEALKRTLSLPRRRAFETSLTLESLMHQVTLCAPGAAAVIEETYVEAD